MSDALPEIQVWRLGRVEYEDGLQLQKLFGQARTQGLVGDSLLLLEHPPVLTLGRAAKATHIIAPAPKLAELGVEVFETNRGGDVTYHGPGQIVGYPIFQLPPGRHDVRRYVRDLEEAMIRAAGAFGVTASRIPKWTGVWVGSEGTDARKLGAIGVHLSRWQTSHGFAFNVNTDLRHFGLIVPCGIREAGVTSLQKETTAPLPMREVEDALVRSFGEIFGGPVIEKRPALATVSVTVLREQRVLLLRRRPERGGFWQVVTGRLERGETPEAAAARELSEETGRELDVAALGYRHAFALGEELPPKVVEETAFGARWPDDRPVRLDPAEHDAYEWVSLDEAARRLPFKGLRNAVAIAARA